MLLPILLAPVAGWLAYGWGAHLLTLGCAWRGPRTARRVALTFDDGPDPEYTPRVLDLLAREDVPATFFLVGERAARAPDVVRAMAAAGHEIGNHTWSHSNLWLCGPRRTDSEIRRAHDLLADLGGRPPRHFRPPWGAVNAAMFGALRRVAARCVFWSIQPEGLQTPTTPGSTSTSSLATKGNCVPEGEVSPGEPGAGLSLLNTRKVAGSVVPD